MQKIKNSLVLRKDDYEILSAYIKAAQSTNTYDKQNAEALEAELKKAKVVTTENFPGDIVRLNSKVKIKNASKNEMMELIVVTPDKANIRERKISIMAPLGTALIGFRKGQKINWKVPLGEMTFTIMEVINQTNKSV